jgi:hypothetical protein
MDEKYMKNENNTEKIPKFIKYALSAYKRRGFVGGILSGEFGKGKTVTALKIAAKILQIKYGYTFEQALEKVIDEHLIFTKDEFIDLTTKVYGQYNWEEMEETQLLKVKYELRKVVLVWDDVGIHAGSKKERFDPSDSWEIQTEYDTIRDITSCMLLTVPEETQIMKSLRSYRSNYFIELGYPAEGGNYNDRVMQFYKYQRDKKTGNMKRRLKFSTNKTHSVHLPDWAYGKYDKKRTLAKLKHNERLQRKKEERELEKQYKIYKKKILLSKWKKELAEVEA